MNGDSPDAGPGVRGETPLFRIGSPEIRLRSVIHSLALVAVAFLFASVVVGVALGGLQGVGLTSDSAPVVFELTQTAVNFLGLLLVTLAYLYWRDERSLIGFRRPTKRDLAVVAGGAVVLVVAIVALETVLSQIGLTPDENVAVQTGRDNPTLFLYYIPVVLFLNSPAEELLFRGVVQGLFRRAYGVVPGIIAAGAIFGGIHYLALAGQGSAAAYVAIAFVSGVVLGALYEYTENLLVPIVVHAAWNVLVYLNLYAQSAGVL
jgi:membrane protease YdiL (CAAX protease family)